MNRLPEPEATKHHSRLVEAICVELRHYGVQSLTDIIATIIEVDANPGVARYTDAFRAIGDTPGDGHPFDKSIARMDYKSVEREA